MEQQAKPVAPLASERLALMGQAAGAKIELDRLIASLQDARATIPAEITAQEGVLAALIREIATAGPTELPALQRAVATAAAAVSAHQSGGSATAADTPDPAARARAARQTIETIGRDLYDKHVLDPYLQFASAEDEAAYRKRERENKAALEQVLALHTPEGDRRAAEIAAAQLEDAKAHGADKAPEFREMETKLDAAEASLKSAASYQKPEKSQDDRAKSPDDELGDIMATLKAAGVEATDPTASNHTPKASAAAEAARKLGGRDT